MKRFLLILSLAAALLSCSPRGRVIPRDELAEIYAEMFLADQWVTERRLRHELDSASLYGAILERHGYKAEDYHTTVEEYLRDPDRFAKIIKSTMKILERREAEIKAEIKRRQSLEDKDKERDAYKPQWRFALSPLDHPDVTHLRDTVLIYVDSVGNKPWIFDNHEYRAFPITDDGHLEIVSVPDGPDQP